MDETQLAALNLQIHIDPRMPPDKIDCMFEAMDKYIFNPPEAAKRDSTASPIVAGIQRLTSQKEITQ